MDGCGSGLARLGTDGGEVVMGGVSRSTIRSPTRSAVRRGLLGKGWPSSIK